VISFNDDSDETHGFYRDDKELIKGCTTSGAEIARGQEILRLTALYKHSDYADVRRKGVVEKCIFCEHRVLHGDCLTV
jgi:hypothetical protein